MFALPIESCILSFVLAIAAALMCIAAVHDAQELKIPNRICLALAGIYPAYLVAHAVVHGSTPDWFGAVLLALVVLVVGMAMFFKGWFGGGDAKLLAAAALWVGPADFLVFFLITTLAGGALALFQMSSARTALTVALRGSAETFGGLMFGRQVPYGIAIAAGALFVLSGSFPV